MMKQKLLFFSISLLLIIFIFGKAPRKPEIDGHRGFGMFGLEPENTIRAFKRAFELGLEYAECDIRYTKDKHLVIMHDATVDRTTNGKGRVADMTLEEIKKLDAGKGEKVPTLIELLQLFKKYPRTKLLIDVKDSNTEQDVVSLLKSTEMLNQVIVIAFDPSVLAKYRSLHPTLELGVLYGTVENKFCETAKKVNATNIGVNYKNLNKEIVEKAEACGLYVWSWSPVTRDEIIRHCEWGVRFLSSDNPPFTKKVVEEWWNSTRRNV